MDASVWAGPLTSLHRLLCGYDSLTRSNPPVERTADDPIGLIHQHEHLLKMLRQRCSIQTLAQQRIADGFQSGNSLQASASQRSASSTSA